MKRKDILIKSCLISIMTFLLTFSNLIYSTMVTDTVMYWKPTSETFTMGWDAPEGIVDGYKVYLYWVQGSEILQTYNMGTTAETQLTISTPRVGCFVAGVRAFNEAGDGPIAYSNNPEQASVNGEPRAWMINYFMDKPGPIIIGKITKEIKKWLR